MKRLLVLCLVIAACGGSGASGSPFILTDGAIDGPEVVASGPGTLQISNRGEFNHTMVVTDRDGQVVAATDVIGPGADVGLEVDLSVGSYLVSCRLVTQTPSGDIVDHYELGMYQNITVED